MARSNPDDDRDLFEELDDDLLKDEDSSADEVTAQAQPAAQDDFFEDTDVPGQLAVDVYQTKDSVVVMAPTPGVSKSDIELSLVDNTLTIRGSRSHSETVSDENFFAQELHWGEFSRSIVLPTQVKEEGAEAELRDGMLMVKMPKTEQDKVKKIEIK